MLYAKNYTKKKHTDLWFCIRRVKVVIYDLSIDQQIFGLLEKALHPISERNF